MCSNLEVVLICERASGDLKVLVGHDLDLNVLVGHDHGHGHGHGAIHDHVMSCQFHVMNGHA